MEVDKYLLSKRVAGNFSGYPFVENMQLNLIFLVDYIHDLHQKDCPTCLVRLADLI